MPRPFNEAAHHLTVTQGVVRGADTERTTAGRGKENGEGGDKGRENEEESVGKEKEKQSDGTAGRE